MIYLIGLYFLISGIYATFIFLKVYKGVWRKFFINLLFGPFNLLFLVYCYIYNIELEVVDA